MQLVCGTGHILQESSGGVVTDGSPLDVVLLFLDRAT